ncbi:MAG: hypothetical protein ACTSPM_01535 [Candidatus Heimdallarchaeota archaeon]
MSGLFPVKRTKQRISKFLCYIPKHSEITEETINEFKEITTIIQNTSAKDMVKLVNYFNQEIQDLIDFSKESLENRKEKIKKIEDAFSKQIREKKEDVLQQLIFTIEFENYKFNLLALSDTEIYINNLESFSEIFFQILDEKIDNTTIKFPFKDSNFKVNYRRNELSRDTTSIKRILDKANIIGEEIRKEYLDKILK